jgi:membrane-bound ClpP family serine protease
VSIWTIASILLLIAAAVFLLRENYDAAFVLAALGAISWILNYRFQIRGKINEETETTDDERDASDEDEDEDEDEE